MRAHFVERQYGFGAAIHRAEQRRPFIASLLEEQLVDRRAQRRVKLPAVPLGTRHGSAEAMPEFRLERAERDPSTATARVHPIAGPIAAQYVFRGRITEPRKQ